MNANELADELEGMTTGWFDDLTLTQSATMLRILDGQLAFRIDAVTKYQAKVDEQQAEIEALKADNEQMYKALVKATQGILRKANEK